MNLPIWWCKHVIKAADYRPDCRKYSKKFPPGVADGSKVFALPFYSVSLVKIGWWKTADYRCRGKSKRDAYNCAREAIIAKIEEV